MTGAYRDAFLIERFANTKQKLAVDEGDDAAGLLFGVAYHAILDWKRIASNRSIFPLKKRKLTFRRYRLPRMKGTDYFEASGATFTCTKGIIFDLDWKLRGLPPTRKI